MYKKLKDVHNKSISFSFLWRNFMNDRPKNIQEKITYENGEDATKYGEFISSYFAWVSLPEQKEIANRLENITKNSVDE